MIKHSIICYEINNTNQKLSEEISKNHRIYCATHNYTYLRTSNILNSFINSTSDYSLVINDLCLFLNMHRAINDFINTEDDLFLPLYQPTKIYNINNNYICSDAFIIRKNAWAVDFLQTWLNSGSKISEFIEQRVDISERCDIQNISILDSSFRICADFAHKNMSRGRESMILNMSGMKLEEIIKTIGEYNYLLGVR
jgi:hypothetical protein